MTDVLLFQLPGLFANWGKLDNARNAMKADFDQQFQSKGFTILGWGDVGAAKVMSIGFEVHHPSDLQGKGCFFLSGDPIGPKVFATIGGINAKEVSVPEILPNLTNGSIQVLITPPLAAEQLQWASRITHISTLTTAFGIGAIIVSTPKMQSLPDNLTQHAHRRRQGRRRQPDPLHPQPRRAVVRAPQEQQERLRAERRREERVEGPVREGARAAAGDGVHAGDVRQGRRAGAVTSAAGVAGQRRCEGNGDAEGEEGGLRLP